MKRLNRGICIVIGVVVFLVGIGIAIHVARLADEDDYFTALVASCASLKEGHLGDLDKAIKGMEAYLSKYQNGIMHEDAEENIELLQELRKCLKPDLSYKEQVLCLHQFLKREQNPVVQDYYTAAEKQIYTICGNAFREYYYKKLKEEPSAYEIGILSEVMRSEELPAQLKEMIPDLCKKGVFIKNSVIYGAKHGRISSDFEGCIFKVSRNETTAEIVQRQTYIMTYGDSPGKMYGEQWEAKSTLYLKDKDDNVIWQKEFKKSTGPLPLDVQFHGAFEDEGVIYHLGNRPQAVEYLNKTIWEVTIPELEAPWGSINIVPQDHQKAYKYLIYGKDEDGIKELKRIIARYPEDKVRYIIDGDSKSYFFGDME